VELSLKVYWREVDGEVDLSQLIDDVRVEEFELPAEGVAELRDCLIKSASILPPTSRTFKDWHVGLLLSK